MDATLDEIQALTPAQAAQVLCVSVRTLALWRHDGSGPEYFMAGRLPRYRAKDIARWQVDRIVGNVRRRCRR